MNDIFNRYELKTGKFSYYFYDKSIGIDLSLNMILSKLNNSEKLLTERLKEIIKLKSERIQLINKNILLKENKE